MTRQFFTDTHAQALSYAGDGPLQLTEADDSLPSQADTVVLDTPWESFFGTDEYVQFDATVAQPIVQTYFHDGEPVQFKKSKAELRTAQAQLDNVGWTMDHPPNDRIVSTDQIRGFWSDPHYEDGQHATLYIPASDTEAVRFAVENDEVSVGFSASLDWTDDADTEYDAVQRDMVYDHVASVENGRCPSEKGCGLHLDQYGFADHGHVHDVDETSLTPMADAVRSTLTEEGEVDKTEAREARNEYRYETEEAARNAAEELNCADADEPIHEFDTPDGTVFVPCTDHDTFRQAFDRERGDEFTYDAAVDVCPCGSFVDISESQRKAIETQREDHDEMDSSEYSPNMSTLVEVYERGAAAWQQSHAPGASQQQWALARVEEFLRDLRSGNALNSGADNDLAPEGYDPPSGSQSAGDASDLTEYDGRMVKETHVYESREDAVEASTEIGCTDGARQMDDGMWVPCSSHSSYIESTDIGDDEMADAKHYGEPTSSDDERLFESETQARAEAAEIGCEDVHEHEVEGETMWMPCSSMDTYRRMTDGCSCGPCECGLHATGDAEINGTTIDLSIPESAQSAAQAYLDAKEDGLVGSDCGTGAGTESARIIADDEVTADRLVSDIAPYLSSHEDDTSRDDHPNGWPEDAWSDCGDAQYAAWGWHSLKEWAFRTADRVKQAMGEEPTYETDAEITIPDFENGDLVRHRYIKDLRGYVAHNPASSPYVMVDPIVDGERSSHTMTFGTPDVELVSKGDGESSSMQMADATTLMDTITYDGIRDGSLDESEIPNEGYEPHYVFDADIKSDSSYPLVDGDGMLRVGNVKAAWELYGRAEDEQFLLDVLAEANDRIAEMDDLSAPIPMDSLSEAMNDSDDTQTAEADTTDDSNTTTTNTKMSDNDSQTPSDPTEFYDGEPDAEALAEDFTAVESLIDTRDDQREQIADLEDALHEYKREEFRDQAERLAELVDRDVENLVEQFDDGDLSVEEVAEKVEVAEAAIGNETTTTTDEAAEEDDGGREMYGVRSRATDSESDGRDIPTTKRGKYVLSDPR